MAMLEPPGIQRGRSLIDLYEGEPYMALWSAALALHVVPERGEFGPAFRDLRKPLDPDTLSGMLHGAILTVIRDFLKLRFRAKGLVDTEAGVPDAIKEGLATGRIQAALEPNEPELIVGYIVNYVVAALDRLSRDLATKPVQKEDFVSFLYKLRGLLREAARRLYPRGREDYDQFLDAAFQRPISEV